MVGWWVGRVRWLTLWHLSALYWCCWLWAGHPGVVLVMMIHRVLAGKQGGRSLKHPYIRGG